MRYTPLQNSEYEIIEVIPSSCSLNIDNIISLNPSKKWKSKKVQEMIKIKLRVKRPGNISKIFIVNNGAVEI